VTRIPPPAIPCKEQKVSLLCATRPQHQCDEQKYQRFSFRVLLLSVTTIPRLRQRKKRYLLDGLASSLAIGQLFIIMPDMFCIIPEVPCIMPPCFII
jgi:hypothetical protein